MAKKNNKDVKRGIVLYLDGKEVKANATAIKAEMNKVRKQIDSCTIGSEEYKRAVEKWKQLQGVMAEHKAQLKMLEHQHESLFSKAHKLFSKYSAEIIGVVAALTGVAIKLNDFRKKASEKEESQANLKALTGLDDESIQWLTEQAEKLSTTMDQTGLRVRKSSKEILEAYMLVGSNKPELLSNKEALNAVTIEAMRLAEASGQDLNEAVGAVTASLNQFNAGADEAGRYVNVLAAGSKYGAANVAEQTAAILKSGVAASSANISIEELVGTIEMLGEKGIKSEEAGTALKRFFLKLQTGADDTNPAVVGLDKALENLANKHLSMGELQKMFGDRAINVAKILIDNTDKVKEYTEAVTDTNVAVEQAAINSNTTAAKMAQLKNQLNETGMELAKRLAPIFRNFIGWTTKFIKALPVILNFLRDYGKEILVVGGYLLVMNARTKIVSATTSAWSKVVGFAKGIQLTWTATIKATNLAMTHGAMTTKAYTAALAKSSTIAKLFSGTIALVRAGVLAVTGQFAKATASVKVFTAAVKANPFAFIVTGVAAAAYGIVKLTKSSNDLTATQKALQNIEKKVNDEYAVQEGHVRRLVNAINNENTSNNLRTQYLAELKSVTHLENLELDSHYKLTKKSTNAINDYLTALQKKIKLEAYEDELKELYKKRRQLEKDKKKSLEELFEENELTWYEKIGTAVGLKNNAVYVRLQKAQLRWDEIRKEWIENKTAISELEGEMDAINNEGPAGGSEDVDDDTDEPLGGTDPKNDKKVQKEDKVKKALEAIELEHQQRMNELKERWRKGEIATQEEYSRLVEELEMERLEKMLQVAGLEPKQRAEIQAKVLDIQLQTKKKFEDLQKALEQAEQKAYEKQLQELDKAKADEMATLEKARKQGVISEEEYQRTLNAILRKYLKERKKAIEGSDEHKKYLELVKKAMYDADQFDKANKQKYETRGLWGGNALPYLKSLQEEIVKTQLELLELDPKDAKYKMVEDYLNGLIKIYEEKGKILTGLVTDIASSLSAGITESFYSGKDALKDALKSMLTMILDAIEKMIEASMLVPTLQALTGIGAGKAWASLFKIALVKATFAALKTSVSHFDTGGFTGKGKWDEPRGIVHAGEFVANRYAVANEAVRPVLDLLDAAQRSGSIQNLTANDIAAVAMRSGSQQASPSVSRQTQTTTHTSLDGETKQLLRECTTAMRRVRERFNLPIVAETYATGRGGVNEAQKLVEKMNNNASRKRKE